MLPQTSAEALHSAAYVQHYLDCVENLPDDLQRYLTRMRELDVSYRACIRDVDRLSSSCTSDDASAARRARSLARLHACLVSAQEIGDEKLQLVQVVQDMIDTKSRQLDQDYRTLVSCMEVSTNGGTEEAAPAEPPPVREKEPPPAPQPPPPARHASPPVERDREKAERDKTGERWSKRARRSRTTTHNTSAHTDGDSGDRDNSERSHNVAHKKGIGKKKKRKARASAARADTPTEEADPIDPDEPRYCLCDQISFGEMILCDNDLCPIEWFHFSCVYLTTKPKGKWFCPKCRGDRPNVMKPKGQFLKELERYNKEKEEKA